MRELLLKPPSGSGEFCTQGFLDSLILITILRSKSKTTLGEVRDRELLLYSAPLQISLALCGHREDRDHSAASLLVYIWGACSGGALGTVVAVEKLCAVYRAGQERHLGSRREAVDQFCVFGGRASWGHAPVMLAAFGREDVRCKATKSKGGNVIIHT